MERRLAVIMAGDIVGYSRLMAEDEVTTYAELRSVFDDVIEPAVTSHGGRIFKNTGDGFLATFPGVNLAVNAAVDIQNGFDGRRFRLRIGVNLGDVIEENGDLYGDGVNVASRLEAMAAPGAIFVSAAVVLSADRSRAAQFFRVGWRHAKNLPEPLEVYSVSREGSQGSAWSRIRQRYPNFGTRIAYAIGATSLISIGLAIQPLPLAAMIGKIPAQISSLADSGTTDPRPSVAVMPFHDMGEDPARAYFADGLTEDITTGLARNPELQVIAPNSTYAVRDGASDVRKLGQKLGVAYVVEGSARRIGDQVRVAAQLIDARSGAHLWSRNYDRPIEDIFAVESELTSEIVSHLVSFVSKAELIDSVKRPTRNLQAYDLVLQARDRFRHGSKDAAALLSARSLFQQALELDPSYAAARAGLGLNYVLDATQTITSSSVARDFELALSEARQSIRLDPNLAIGYQVISYGLAASGDHAGALQAAQRAVELNPNDPDSMMALSKAQVRFGDYQAAVRNAERARRLNPMAPEYYAWIHGQALYAAGRRKEAETVIGECLMRAPQDTNCLLIQAALQVDRSELDKAKTTMARLVSAKPEFSIDAERLFKRFGDSPLMEQFLAALARAKAPETAFLPSRVQAS